MRQYSTVINIVSFFKSLNQFVSKVAQMFTATLFKSHQGALGA